MLADSHKYVQVVQRCHLPKQNGRGLRAPKFFEKRKVNGRERNVYKLKNKLFIKVQGEFVGLSNYLKQHTKKFT
jgi:hypothetical protein